MKRNWKELIARIIILLVGLTIAHFGVTLFILTKMGADPFNVLVGGIFNAIGIASHGTVHLFICALITLILLFVDRTYIKIGTVICMAFGGPIIDFFSLLLEDIVTPELSYPLKIAIVSAGCIILAYGMTIVIKSDAGTGPNDLVAIAISDKAHFKFSITRIVTDFVFVLVGFPLGGDAHVGTIICAFLVGFVAEWFLPFNEKLVQKVLSKYR